MRNDTEQRSRAVSDTSHSFLVEASAGTGKTSTLINRILSLVMDRGPQGVPLSLSQICAITFTEKAAGEMKVRLRQRLEERGSAAGAAGVRARDVLRDLETAAISTFHSFAVSLLKERPIEARLDPQFKTLDEMQSELFFNGVWEPWLNKAIRERAPLLAKALRQGVSLTMLRDVARTLRLHATVVRELGLASLPDNEEIRLDMQRRLEQGRRLRKRSHAPADKLVPLLDRALEWLADSSQAADRPAKPGSSGSQANWDGGKDTVDEVRLFLRNVADFSAELALRPARILSRDVVSWIRASFLPEWEARKRAEGLLDFDDLLIFARDLLMNSRSARRDFQSRFAVLLVDEFQDTDTIQWDLVLLLTSADLGITDPNRLTPAPGRLFIVGDPKQSIYRFRGADIETYLAVSEAQKNTGPHLERLELTTNFRSVPSIRRFVDTAFARAMLPAAGKRYQPAYLPFDEAGGRCDEWTPPSVHLLADKGIGLLTVSAADAFKREASRVAKLISRMPGSESWRVEERSGAPHARPSWRPPHFGDIAILLPVLTRADVLEEALREAEIPYVLEGGKFYYARSEVASAINVLQAIADPNDTIALYGALRSIFFGLSDEDLLRARVEGVPLDYRLEIVPVSPLARPFAILRGLHGGRHERPASETLQLLLRSTGAREVLAARGFQSLANLNKLVRTLRLLQQDATFSQAVTLLRAMDEAGFSESESRLMEEHSDAVRVMSIHKAKGLDFPIVILSGLGLQRRSRTPSFLYDRHKLGAFALSLGSRLTGLQTPGWQELAEVDKDQDEAELVRLLYVALTRARDHVILGVHARKLKEVSGEDALLPDLEGTRLEPISATIDDVLMGMSSQAEVMDVGSLDADVVPRRKSPHIGIREQSRKLAGEYESLRRLLSETPHSKRFRAVARDEEDSVEATAPREHPFPEIARGRSIRLGVAFHEAMEKVNLMNDMGTADAVFDAGTRQRLEPHALQELEGMVRRTLSSPLILRVRSAIRGGGRILRELPFVRPLEQGSIIEEGKVDLLFEEDGRWTLVDYKTDLIGGKGDPQGVLFKKYGGQVRAYAEALLALGIEVSRAYLWLARSGEEVEMPLGSERSS
jgi:ATP-dependent helicase/nuclease subunit A